MADPTPAPHDRVDAVAALQSEDQERICWICYEGQKAGTLVSPCACRGDTKWVHSACLLTWIDEKQGGIPQTRVQCPQCTVDYIIAMPPATPFMHLYARVVAVQHTLIPFVGGIGTLLGGYICASSYGLYAIAQAVGVEEWVALSSHFDENPWQFYVGVPLIPVGLISTRFARLEALLPFLPLAVFYSPQLSFRPLNPQTLLFALPYLRFAYNAMRLAVFETVLNAPQPLLMDGASETPSGEGIVSSPAVMSAETSADTVVAAAGRNEARQALTETNPLRAVVGALLLPAVSAVTGNMTLHRFVPNNFLRTVLGGCLFIILRDAANLLFSYQAVRRRRTRRILPYHGHGVPRLM